MANASGNVTHPSNANSNGVKPVFELTVILYVNVAYGSSSDQLFGFF